MVSYRFLVRGGLAANLVTVNEVLLSRELCYETDTGKGKLGDGVTPWNSLAYLPGGGGGGSVWRTGTGVPSDSLGDDGDMYLDIDTSDVYQRVLGEYELVANIKGQAGAISGQLIFGTGDRINPITVGAKALVPVTFAGEIVAVQTHIVTSDGLDGSVVIDIRKCSYGDFVATRPDAADSITAGTPPTITTALKSQDTTLTDWTTAFVAGDVFLAYVVSRSANVVHAVVAISIEKST